MPQVVHRVDGPARQRGEDDVVGDEVRADVGALGGALAPRGELAEDRQLATAELLPSLHPLVALLGRHGRVPRRFLERAHLLVGPRDAAPSLEVRAQPVVQREQVVDIVRGIRELLAPEWPAHPIRVGLVLLDLHLQHALEERREPHLEAVAEEGRLDLRIEDAADRIARERREDLEVLRTAVQHHRHRRVAQHRGECAEVGHRDRVDHGDAAVRRHLDDAEHGAVRPLPDELRVEREPPRGAELRRERVERVRRGDQPGFLHGMVRQGTSRPARGAVRLPRGGSARRRRRAPCRSRGW